MVSEVKNKLLYASVVEEQYCKFKGILYMYVKRCVLALYIVYCGLGKY